MPARPGRARTGCAGRQPAGPGGGRPGRGLVGGGPLRPVRLMSTARVAAIDCGTNSLRLLVADVDPAAGRLTDVDRRVAVVRRGRGADSTGRLAPEALERTLRALAGYARIIRDLSVGAVRMVATSATRDAANAGDCVQGVKGILGLEPEVLSGMDEAWLSFTGATAEFGAPGGPAGPVSGPCLVVDIGGGSTEFVLGEAGASGAGYRGPGGLSAVSGGLGCVRLPERRRHSDPPPLKTAATTRSKAQQTPMAPPATSTDGFGGGEMIWLDLSPPPVELSLR